MRRALAPGSFFGGATTVLGGIITIVTTDADWWGMGAIVIGIGLWIWAFTVDGEHWWRRIVPAVRKKSPLKVSGVLLADCVAVTDQWGVAQTPLWAVSLCLEVKNDSANGRALRGLQARSEDLGESSRVPLLFRQGGSLVPSIDLAHGQVALLEVGFVFVQTSAVSPPAPICNVLVRKCVPHSGLAVAFENAATNLTLQLSGDETRGYISGGQFRIVVSAEDFPAYRKRFEVDFSYPQEPIRWLKF